MRSCVIDFHVGPLSIGGEIWRKIQHGIRAVITGYIKQSILNKGKNLTTNTSDAPALVPHFRKSLAYGVMSITSAWRIGRWPQERIPEFIDRDKYGNESGF